MSFGYDRLNRLNFDQDEEKSVSDVDIINIGSFNLYKSMDDRTRFKGVINKLFESGDEIFFFFRREEDLTDDDSKYIN